MAIELFINSVDRTNLLQFNSLVIDDAIGERSTCRFLLSDTSGLLSFNEGEPVLIFSDSVLIFGGSIFYPKKFNPLQTNILFFDIECVDFNEIADRFIVAESYVNETSGDVVTDLYNTYLINEGVTIGQINAGILVQAAKFPRVSNLTSVLDELAEFNGFIWYIDYDKKFYFVDRTFNDTLQTFTNNSKIRNVQVKFNKSQLRNRQYIRGGNNQTDLISLEKPTPKPDGVSKTFFTRFPLANTPRIFVDSVEVDESDIGINGRDTGKEWYYQINNNAIVQDDSEITLTTELLEVTYRGLFPLLVVAENPASISNRQNIEGGTGIYEAIETDVTIDQAAFGLEIAQSKLLKYSERQIEVTFESFEPVFSGDLITFDFPIYDLNQKVLVDNVQIIEYVDNQYVYQVHAVSGESFGSWSQFFKRLYNKPDKIVIRDDEILVILTTAFESQNWGESAIINVIVCPLPAEDLFPSEVLLPC
jgi:hypothetical protein